MGYYLAIDIGETKGHHMLGYLEKDKLRVEEIYQFDNTVIDHDGEKCWDLVNLFKEIKTGLIKCRERNMLPILVGIDTWGEDFVLLDQEDKVIGNTIAIRPKSTTNHLLSIKDNHPDHLEKATALLMLPDYFNFLLTGVKLSEYTIAMTSQLVNPVTQQWDEELIKKLDYPHSIFQEIRRPGTVIGNLSRAVTEEVGYDCIIVLPATHDASSAFFALSSKANTDLSYNKEEELILRSSEGESEFSAAAIGNILVQMIISHELKDVQAAQECVLNSFEFGVQESKSEL